MSTPERPLRLVTGAFGFTGRHVTELLLARGLRVRTLTGHPGRENPFGAPGDVILTRDEVEGLRRYEHGGRCRR
jgi:nucleoside-diphosphate-sugar epimerase